MYGDQQRTKTETRKTQNKFLDGRIPDLMDSLRWKDNKWRCFVVVHSPKMITKVIFIVLTFALGMRPRELVLRVSASSRASLCRLASVRGTETWKQINILRMCRHGINMILVNKHPRLWRFIERLKFENGKLWRRWEEWIMWELYTRPG